MKFLIPQLKQNKLLFIAIIILKIVLLSVFSSEFNDALFYPFVNSFIQNTTNPWQYYFQNNLPLDAFPFHPLMLYILYIFKTLGFFAPYLFFKIPILLADIGIFVLLNNLLKNKTKEILLLYFLNPIIIYVCYIHCQLDIIPTSLTCLSVYYLIRNKNLLSALIFGCALSTKFNVFIALPLIVFYLYKSNKFIDIIKYISIVMSIFLFFDLPYLSSQGFINMVIFNQKQNLLFDFYFVINNVKIYIVIAILLIIYFPFFYYKKINWELLFFYFGLVFIGVIIFINPSPGWIIWSIPFISLFFINTFQNKKNIFLYISFCTSYLIFFLFFYQTPYKEILFCGNPINLKLPNNLLSNISYTIFVSITLVLIIVYYQYGLKSNSIYNKSKNLIIGIGGDSGAGKTSLLSLLRNIFSEKLLELEGDGEHKWERGNEQWKTITHLDPKANFIYKQADIIADLKNHKSVFRSDYDHNTGKFTPLKKIIPKDYIVIAGLHPFYLPMMRKNIDLKIYLDTDEKIRTHWKVLRDTKKRNYTLEKINQQIEERSSDALKYIYPQKEYADVIIQYFSNNHFQIGTPNENIELGLKIIFDANINTENILSDLNTDIIWNYNDDLKTQFLELKQQPNIDFENLAQIHIINYIDILGVNFEWKQGYEGMIQFIILKIISEKLKVDKYEI